jgi:hypothetical protein
VALPNSATYGTYDIDTTRAQVDVSGMLGSVAASALLVQEWRKMQPREMCKFCHAKCQYRRRHYRRLGERVGCG